MAPALFLADAASQNLSVFDPASPSTDWIRHLFILVLVITGVIFLIVEGVLIYSLCRFRRTPDSGNNEPPQVYGSMPIEIAWTAAPALIVFVLILVLVRTELEVRRDPATPPEGAKPLYVTVIGHQWWWEYVYDKYDGKDLGFITANELHVPVSTAETPRPVYLTLKSADVCHSFWVPRLAGKTDLIPGRTNQLWFQTDTPGIYLGQCAEYCGTQHANMLLRVIVDAPNRFESWLRAERQPASPRAQLRSGRAAFFSQNCVNCHTVRFPGSTANGTVGPDLTHLMTRTTLASGMVPNLANNDGQILRQWIVNPQKIKPGCLMPAMNLTNEQVNQVVDYLTGLR